MGQHAGSDTFRPLLLTAAVQKLLSESSRVIKRTDTQDSKQEMFRTLSKVVNMEGFKRFGLAASTSHALTITTTEVSRLLNHSSLQTHQRAPLPPKAHHSPFSLRPRSNTSQTCWPSLRPPNSPETVTSSQACLRDALQSYLMLFAPAISKLGSISPDCFLCTKCLNIKGVSPPTQFRRSHH